MATAPKPKRPRGTPPPADELHRLAALAHRAVDGAIEVARDDPRRLGRTLTVFRVALVYLSDVAGGLDDVGPANGAMTAGERR